jgi:hypothetical protein
VNGRRPRGPEGSELSAPSPPHAPLSVIQPCPCPAEEPSGLRRPPTEGRLSFLPRNAHRLPPIVQRLPPRSRARVGRGTNSNHARDRPSGGFLGISTCHGFEEGDRVGQHGMGGVGVHRRSLRSRRRSQRMDDVEEVITKVSENIPPYRSVEAHIRRAKSSRSDAWAGFLR